MIMMCCTADRIMASQFAVLGSIGVISEIPNAYERLNKKRVLNLLQQSQQGSINVPSNPLRRLRKKI